MGSLRVSVTATAVLLALGVLLIVVFEGHELDQQKMRVPACPPTAAPPTQPTQEWDHKFRSIGREGDDEEETEYEGEERDRDEELLRLWSHKHKSLMYVGQYVVWPGGKSVSEGVVGEENRLFLLNLDQAEGTTDYLQGRLIRLDSQAMFNMHRHEHNAKTVEGWEHIEEEVLEHLEANDRPGNWTETASWQLYSMTYKVMLPGEYSANVTLSLRNEPLESTYSGSWRSDSHYWFGNTSAPDTIFFVAPVTIYEAPQPLPELPDECDWKTDRFGWLGPPQPHHCPDEAQEGLLAFPETDGTVTDGSQLTWHHDDCKTRIICRREAVQCLRRFEELFVVGDSLGREFAEDLNMVLMSPSPESLIWTGLFSTFEFEETLEVGGWSHTEKKWLDWTTQRTCEGHVIRQEAIDEYNAPWRFEELDKADKVPDNDCDRVTTLHEAFRTVKFDVKAEADQTMDVCVLGMGTHPIWHETLEIFEEALHYNLAQVSTQSDSPSGLQCSRLYVLGLPAGHSTSGLRTARRIVEWNKRMKEIGAEYGAFYLDTWAVTSLYRERAGGVHVSRSRGWVPGWSENLNGWFPSVSTYYLQDFLTHLCPDLAAFIDEP